MVVGMATRKVTITLEESALARIHDLVTQGAANSLSGFVKHAVAVALDDLAGWEAVLADGLATTGGDLTDEERAWADTVLGTGATTGTVPAA
jgi:Arc/MetJ-type ribon-helix-helix transcriptional regulator